MVQFNIDFLGTTVVDRLFSNPMIPWVIADVKRRKKIQKVNLTIENGEIIVRTDDVVIFRHQTQNVHRFCLEPNNMRTFMYLVRDEFEPVYNVYLFQTTEFEDVVEIFQTMRESVREHPNMTKSHSSAATLTSLCPDISPTNSQFFEVLYVGKIKVSHRKVPETFIDDALEKIRLYELEKSRKLMEQINADNEKYKSTESVLMPNKGNCDTEKGDCTVDSVNIRKESDAQKVDRVGTSLGQGELKQSEGNAQNNRVCDGANKKSEVSSDSEKGKSDPVSEMRLEGRTNRARAGSLGVIETFRKKVDDANQNRTMLFYVGRSDLRLISPDRKQVLLHKMLKDINSCVQGIENNQHFGIISREVDSYFGYVFKCESDSVADHIVSAITQSFQSMRENKEKSKQPVLSCEHCPMLWFHKLCAEIEGVNEKKTQLTILKKIETLPEEEQIDIHTKFLGAESSDIKEQNEFLMILLRTHCERKQTRHVHDTAETRSEFLNQVLGGNTIFMKAKRSLTSSFDQLLKRKGSQTDIFHSKESVNRKSDSTINECKNEDYQRSYLTVGPSDGEIMRKEISRQMSNKTDSNDLKKRFQKDKSFSIDPNKISQVNKSSCPDISSLSTNKVENADLSSPDDTDTGDTEASKTPMINIFLKVGSASKSPPQDNFFPEETCQTPSGSWRQAIFNRVVTPGKSDEADDKIPRKRTKEELRELWKTAINQQILLIRMEKENARLRASQEEATVKRIKLEYEELGTSNKEYMAIWDMVSNKDNRISSKCDSQILFQAVRQGIPRSKRGDVWYFLAVQFCLKQPPFDSTGFPNYDVPYEDLLKQLTSFQHAILIDLGRTFPNHSYFSSPLGPGQLALFNLLKAYSLLDPQVGYCQGLSFVAGVLLLHMSEDNAFLLLRHLMFRRGLRKQYLPDMAALQVQLYQLSRLIHDTLPKLYAHFDKNEIAPTLYAASWMLTLFASQFPLGFVTRVFDLLFMEHTTEVIFRVVMALLEQHKEELLKLTTFEEIMEYLKSDVPKMDSSCVDRIMKKVLTMDITKQLHEYEVEYHVLQEEMSTPRPELDQLKKVKIENKRLKDQNSALMDQLEMVNKNLNRLEKFRSAQQSTINKLETKIRSLEITVKVLGDFISETSEEHKDIEVPGQIRRIIANLEAVKLPGGKTETVGKKPFDKTAFFKRIHSSIDFHDKPHFSELCTPDDLPNGTTYKDHGKDERHEDPGKPSVIRGVPLKVIVDDDEEDIKKRLHQHSPNLTSKITSGVSSFFNSSHNQIIKNQKNKKPTQEPGLGNGVNSKPSEVDNWRSGKHNFSSEIGSLSIKDSVIHSQKKEKSPNNNEIPNQMKDDTSALRPTNPTAADAEAPTQIVTHFHPLDNCNDVNITYNGTTKLKSIKSGHKLIRNNTIDLIPVNNGYLHISEDEMPSKENKVEFSSKSMKETFTESF